jgi:hypothetical protein
MKLDPTQIIQDALEALACECLSLGEIDTSVDGEQVDPLECLQHALDHLQESPRIIKHTCARCGTVIFIRPENIREYLCCSCNKWIKE